MNSHDHSWVSQKYSGQGFKEYLTSQSQARRLMVNISKPMLPLTQIKPDYSDNLKFVVLLKVSAPAVHL